MKVAFVRLTVLAALASLALGAVTAAFAQGPYGGGGLPAGVTQVTVGGSNVTLNATPTVTSCNISGKVTKTSGTVSVQVEGSAAVTANVGADGSFTAAITCTTAGTKKVFIDGAQVGSINVTLSAPPRPPATGSGFGSGNDTVLMLVMGAAVLALAGGAGFVAARRK